MSNFNSTPRDGIMTITPDIAADWLEHRNKGNRHISTAIVKQYADAMREGRWMITHQGIAFDENGNLLDGQHRLWGSVEAGVPFQAMVTVGVPRETFAVLDTGRRRQASQLIDGKHRTMVASAARILAYYDGTIGPDVQLQGGIVPNKIDNDIIVQTVGRWTELAEWAPAVNVAYRSARILQSSHLAVIAQAARTPYGELISSWFDGINTGAGLAADDPRLVLRNRFIRGADITGGGSIRMARSYQLIVKAWNAHALGKPVRTLKIMPDQKIPVVVGLEERVADR